MVFSALACAAVLIATAPLAVMVSNAARARHLIYGICAGIRQDAVWSLRAIGC